MILDVVSPQLGTSFVPIMPGSVLTSPPSLSHVYQGVMDKTTNFWAYRMVRQMFSIVLLFFIICSFDVPRHQVLNLAQVKFNYMIADIQETQISLESESQELVNIISAKYADADLSSNATQEEITDLLTRNAVKARDAFLELFDNLMFKYADGWINSWSSSGFSSKNIGLDHRYYLF